VKYLSKKINQDEDIKIQEAVKQALQLNLFQSKKESLAEIEESNRLPGFSKQSINNIDNQVKQPAAMDMDSENPDTMIPKKSAENEKGNFYYLPEKPENKNQEFIVNFSDNNAKYSKTFQQENIKTIPSPQKTDSKNESVEEKLSHDDILNKEKGQPSLLKSILGSIMTMIFFSYFFILPYTLNKWRRWRRGFKRGNADFNEFKSALAWTAISVGLFMILGISTSIDLFVT
jgi:hypothetical protein